MAMDIPECAWPTPQPWGLTHSNMQPRRMLQRYSHFWATSVVMCHTMMHHTHAHTSALRFSFAFWWRILCRIQMTANTAPTMRQKTPHIAPISAALAAVTMLGLQQ